MNRALKFTAHDAFYRLEATVSARLKCWLIQVFRNEMKVGETQGAPRDLRRESLLSAFRRARSLVEQGLWEPGAASYPWCASDEP